MELAQDNKTKIINSSIKLFAQKTFAGVNLQDIVKDSGVSVGSIYNFFPKGKFGIALFIDQQYIEVFNTEFIGLLKNNIVQTDFQKLIDDLLDCYLRICNQFPCYFDSGFLDYVCSQNSDDDFNTNLIGYLVNVIQIKNSKLSLDEIQLRSKLIITIWDVLLEEYFATKNQAILTHLKTITYKYLHD